MRYLIDSNIWLYASSDEQQVVKFLDEAEDAEWAGYSAITRLEIFGFPDLKPEHEAKLNDLLKCFSEAPVGSDVIDKAIEIRKGKRVRSPDAIIAATALLMAAKLVTRNTDDFKGIKGLEVMDPFRK